MTRSTLDNQATAAIPAMRVARNDSFLGVVDLDKAVTWMLDQPPFNKKPEEAENVRAMMLSPQMLEVLTGKMGEIWGTWVGAWLANGLAPGETLRLQSGVQFGTRLRQVLRGSLILAPSRTRRE